MGGSAKVPAGPALLVVEGEPNVARALREGLVAEGFLVSLAQTGEDGLFLASARPFDLVILDPMFPERDGLEILAALRRMGVLTPVLVLTARDGVDALAAELDAGADDYVVKPFGFSELLFRVRALTRRGPDDQTTLLSFADLYLDVSARSVTRGGARIELTRREFELLEYLLRHKGTLVSREMLVRDVLRESNRCTALDNVIDVHIARLRKRVDEGRALKLIHSVRGVGFTVSDEALRF